MKDNMQGVINRLLTASMLVLLTIACQQTPDNKTFNWQPTQQERVRQ
jgi:hypothetical protein